MQLLRKKVLRYIVEQGLFTPGETIVVAFSGGADSTALLDILANLADFPLKLVLAHLNHCLRGEDSEGDALFAGTVSKKYALPIEISRVDVTAAAEANRLSLEEAGRNARYSFLREVAEKHSAGAVALGHHRNDQAETVLMRLIRGSAGSGLVGMKPKSSDKVFVRPLLCLSRTEIESYLCKGGMHWREDSSNADIKFLRNRIRHELLPLLNTYNPAITESLNQTAQALAADEELLAAVVERVYAQITTTSPGEISLDVKLLLLQPEALRKRLYRQALCNLQGNLRGISAQHLVDIDRLATGDKGSGKLSLPSGLLVIRNYAALILTNIPEKRLEVPGRLSLNSCGVYTLAPDQTLVLEEIESLPTSWRNLGKDTIFVDSRRLPFPWTIRYFSDGDRFTPFGMEGTKKLKELFIDRKIPHAARKMIPLFLCRGTIFWVGGVQVAEDTRITEPSNQLLQLRIISSSPEDRH